MTNTIIDKIQEKSQNILSSKIIKVIISSLVLIILLILVLYGYSFFVVYSGITASLIFVGIISIWVKPLRSIFRWILVVGAIFYLGENIILAKVMPFLDNQISKNIPSYTDWKKNRWTVTDSKFSEGTISMKKELMNSEINKGVFGIIKEDSPAYGEKGELIKNLFFKKGQKIMSLGLKSKPQLQGSEGMAYVLCANEYGDFVNSKSALVPIRKIEWSSNTKEEAKKSPAKPPEWETVKDCPIHFVGRIFDDRVGPNGERPYTGEVYADCFLENGYDYKITFSGEYTKRLATQEHKVSWRGFNPQSQGMVKPFPSYNFGALLLRLSNKEGLHPETDKDFIVFTPAESVKIFAEANVNREEEEYRDKKGSKLKNSTLSLKLERRPL